MDSSQMKTLGVVHATVRTQSRVVLEEALPTTHRQGWANLQTKNSVVDDKHGWAALHVAAASGDLQLVKALLDSGMEPMVKCKSFEQTPLHVAAAHGEHQIVKELCERHQELVGSRDRANFTAITYAAAEGYRKVVEVLVEFMRDPSLIPMVNEALMVAQESFNSKVASTLQKFLSEHLMIPTQEIEDITKFLTDEAELPQYVNAFITSGYTNLKFWSTTGISEEEYKQMGILAPGHRKILNVRLHSYAKRHGYLHNTNEAGSDGDEEEEEEEESSSEGSSSEEESSSGDEESD